MGKSHFYASLLLEGGVYSVEMLQTLLDSQVLSIDRLCQMKFPRPVAQIMKRTKRSFMFNPDEDLESWLRLSLGGEAQSSDSLISHPIDIRYSIAQGDHLSSGWNGISHFGDT